MINKIHKSIFNIFTGLHIKKTTILYIAMLLNVALGYIITKINTNFLTLTEFGMYSLFINTILFSRVFFSFGLFETTARIVAIEKNFMVIREYYAANLIFALILGVLLNITILFLSVFFDNIFEIHIGSLLFIFSPFVFAILLQIMIQTVLRGFNYIGMLSTYTLMPRLVYILSLAALISLRKFNLNTTTGAFLLTLLGVCLIYAFLLKPRFNQLKERFNTLLSEIKNFGSNLYIANIFTAFSFHIDKLILALFIDAKQLAYYSLAFTLTAPIPYFSNALSTSAFKNFAQYTSIPKRHLYLNFIYTIAVSILLIIFRKFIVVSLFSDRFLPSISSFIILTIAFALNALSVPYTMFFKAQGKGKEIRNITFYVQILFISANLILIPKIGITGAAIAVLMAFGFDYSLYLFYYFRLFKIRRRLF
jgi:O-antigen/teichoic acid export membrane protein